jgi:hypothetical protein
VLLVSTIRKIGPPTVLWVVEAEPGRPPGSVERVSEALLRGYAGWIDVRPTQNIDLASWSSVCVGAHLEGYCNTSCRAMKSGTCHASLAS